MVLGVAIALAGLPMYVINHRHFINRCFGFFAFVAAVVLIVVIFLVLRRRKVWDPHKPFAPIP